MKGNWEDDDLTDARAFRDRSLIVGFIHYPLLSIEKSAETAANVHHISLVWIFPFPPSL
jgi:hypothetical protein